MDENGPLSKSRLSICVVGTGGVGKSSLTLRYTSGSFPEVRKRDRKSRKEGENEMFSPFVFFVFLQYYDPTIGKYHLRLINGYLTSVSTPEESYITQVEYGFNYHDVEIFDTAGQEEFMQFRDTSMRQGDAFLLMFAINSISSWVHLKELRTKIVREKEDETGSSMIPMVIVANKRVSV